MGSMFDDLYAIIIVPRHRFPEALSVIREVSRDAARMSVNCHALACIDAIGICLLQACYHAHLGSLGSLEAGGKCMCEKLARW